MSERIDVEAIEAPIRWALERPWTKDTMPDPHEALVALDALVGALAAVREEAWNVVSWAEVGTLDIETAAAIKGLEKALELLSPDPTQEDVP